MYAEVLRWNESRREAMPAQMNRFSALADSESDDIDDSWIAVPHSGFLEAAVQISLKDLLAAESTQEALPFSSTQHISNYS